MVRHSAVCPMRSDSHSVKIMMTSRSIRICSQPAFLISRMFRIRSKQFILTDSIRTVRLAPPELPKRSSPPTMLLSSTPSITLAGVRIYELPASPSKVKAGLDIIAKGGKVEPPKKYFLGPDLYDELEKIKANPV